MVHFDVVKCEAMTQMFSKQLEQGTENKAAYLQWLLTHLTAAPPRLLKIKR